MEAPAPDGRDGTSAPPPRATAWVVSPHRLVAQAVAAGLRSTGAPVEFHAWEALLGDVLPTTGEDRVRHVLAIFDGVDPPGALEELGRIVSRGDARVAVVTSAPDALLWGGLLEGTAVDIVTMTTSVGQLAEVVQRLTAGEPLMEPERRRALRTAWLEALDKRHQLVEQMAALSPQQLRVLQMLASGRRVPEVAELMGIAEGTVRSHVKSLRAKLGARTQLEAVALLRQVHELGGSADLVPRPRSAPADAEAAARRR